MSSKSPNCYRPAQEGNLFRDCNTTSTRKVGLLQRAEEEPDSNIVSSEVRSFITALTCGLLLLDSSIILSVSIFIISVLLLLQLLLLSSILLAYCDFLPRDRLECFKSAQRIHTKRTRYFTRHFNND